MLFFITKQIIFHTLNISSSYTYIISRPALRQSNKRSHVRASVQRVDHNGASDKWVGKAVENCIHLKGSGS